MTKITTAVIGAGGWGKNLVKTLASMDSADLKYVCDLDENLLSSFREQYPGIDITTDHNEILADGSVTAVVIAAPADLHYRLVKQSLQTGRLHVFSEKPLSLTRDEADELAKMSEETGLTLMVGHLLLYHPAVTRLKEIVESGELGDILCMYSNRQNLGKIRSVENVWWSLAPHDISVMMYLTGTKPLSISAHGKSFIQPGIPDTVFAAMQFPENVLGHVHASWLDPQKVRKTTIVGSRKMAIFDDGEPENKLQMYDKRAVNENGVVSLHNGEVEFPAFGDAMPLTVELEHFLESVRTGKRPLTDALNGRDVAHVLQAGEESILNGGKTVTL